MENKLVSGIFIPYVLVSSFEIDAIESKVENLLAGNKQRLQKLLKNCGNYVLQDACMISDKVVYLGLFFKPEQPLQRIYRQVWNIVKVNAGIDVLRKKGYTVPLNNVIAANLGFVTRSLVACDKKITLNQATEIIRRFQMRCQIPADLILSWNGEVYELHGTSPLQADEGQEFVWQNYMDRAFDAVLPHVDVTFYQSWSTSDELEKRLICERLGSSAL